MNTRQRRLLAANSLTDSDTHTLSFDSSAKHAGKENPSLENAGPLTPEDSRTEAKPEAVDVSCHASTGVTFSKKSPRALAFPPCQRPGQLVRRLEAASQCV